MCNEGCLDFARQCLSEARVKGRRVLEVGAWTDGGSVRPMIEAWKPAEYVGIDLQPGPTVDEVLDAKDLVRRYGPRSFDLVIATEVLEHVLEWRDVISNIKQVLRPGGAALLTTRSRGFRIHAYPHDYWRFDAGDLKEIFADFDILQVARDPVAPGVFLFATRPAEWKERNLEDVRAYSLAALRRVRRVTKAEMLLYRARVGPIWHVAMLRHATLRGIVRKRLAIGPLKRFFR